MAKRFKLPPLRDFEKLALESKRDEFECLICKEKKSKEHAANLGKCVHLFCRKCMVRHLSIRAKSKEWPPILCPWFGCELDTWECAVFLDECCAKGGEKLRSLHIMDSIESLEYCANPKCSLPFDYVASDNANCSDVVCPLCKVATCVRCKTPWHEGQTCKQVREKDPLNALKEQQQWKHCPRCNRLIEHVDGCKHMLCHCGYGFCYDCEKPYIPRCDCDAASGRQN